MFLGGADRESHLVSEEPPLLAVAVLALFAAALRVAIDFRTGAVAGLLALMAFLAIELGLPLNPAAWWRRDRP